MSKKKKTEEEAHEKQVYRILSMYDRLKSGECIVKKEEVARFHTSDKTIQRDLQSIRGFLETEKIGEYVDYDRQQRGYVLRQPVRSWLTNEEIFAVLKVLIDSRAFRKNEMHDLIDKLTALTKKEDAAIIQKMMLNEKYLYVELQHQKSLIELLWQLSTVIQRKHVIELYYKSEMDEHTKQHIVKPVGIIFSEFYFYLIGYTAKVGSAYPIIFRVDRIEHFDETFEGFVIPENMRFQEGEFRKRVQFMYPGELTTVRFKFKGRSPQAVMDRLPTARILKKEDGYTMFEAEVFGNGIKIWLLSQGADLELTYPPSLRAELIEAIEGNRKLYE
ncbi:MAG: WYL domain-containing protein [Caryophanon sp.]|nr:WYL domain-containing protein [Caryophanon sp.]